MTITEQIAALEAYQGCARRPDDLESFWSRRLAPMAKLSKCQTRPVPYQNAAAVYEELSIPSADGGVIHARHIRPVGDGPFPTILMFHDLGRKTRGWHHMTRFIALGYAVVALENRLDVSDRIEKLPALKLERSYTDAFAAATAAMTLPHTDTAHLATWGEGFGGALAIVTAALVPAVTRCAALNPMPADFRRMNGDLDEKLLSTLDHMDPVNLAPLLKGPLLMGTGLLDRVAPPEGQYAIYNRAACPKRHLVYPKYEHERINFFENELLKFLYL